MTGPDFTKSWLDHFQQVLLAPSLSDSLDEAHEIVAGVRDRGGKLVFAGNGASATMASHYALDFTKQAGVRSIAFNDAALITAYANDFGYEHFVARAVEHHAKEGDAAVLISTSGRSPNIVNAAAECQKRSIPVLAFTGFSADNPLNELATVTFWAESRAYNVVEAVHATWLGLLCDLIIGKREYDVSG